MRLVLLCVVLVHAAVARRHHHHRLPETTPSVDKERMVVDAATGIRYNPYGKHHSGRHVCSRNLTSKTKQIFCKPVYKKYQQRCQGNQLCTGVKLEYETTYKDVGPSKASKIYSFACCPGWTQITNRSHGCNKPICSLPCQNGGSCVKPDVCACLKGYFGKQCEFDIDECKEQKPCDQICYNTPGSYHCQCRENFILKEDGQSCRKEDEDGTALEARDLEIELLDKRIVKLETMVDEMHKNEAPKKEIDEINSKVFDMSKGLTVLTSRVNSLEPFKQDLNIVRYKLSQIESRVNKVDDLNYKFEKMKTCLFMNKICV